MVDLKGRVIDAEPVIEEYGIGADAVPVGVSMVVVVCQGVRSRFDQGGETWL